MRPYRPDTLPVENLDYRQLLLLVGQANAALARYDGLLQGIPNPALMLSPLTTREAVLSSIWNRIEMSTIARLQAISSSGDWNSWIKYFLRAIIQQA